MKFSELEGKDADHKALLLGRVPYVVLRMRAAKRPPEIEMESGCIRVHKLTPYRGGTQTQGVMCDS